VGDVITTVPRQQFFAALAYVSGMNDTYQTVSTDANYPDWVEFNSAKLVQVGDPLYVLTQLALGYTSADMRALFDIAVYQRFEVTDGFVLETAPFFLLLEDGGYLLQG
jgi:hypothetical protein